MKSLTYSSSEKQNIWIVKGGYHPLGGGVSEICGYVLEEKVLGGDLEVMMKQFWCVNDVRSISSSDAATLDNGIEETTYGVAGTISPTSDGVISHHETGARSGGV